ncbi:RNA polymerase sigma factor [Termitidicoccus mucosus]|uniref:RNA polymerase subunit sigma-24 n=1 Tax=Termitidicoccus mucosus TaxID=1184151 RepID=A0A178IPL5_9BACT|nr:RNA polymerase subunit sigma-24 [Opitutaceae bacterium TSB47]
MDQETIPDENLVERIRNDDETALLALMRKYYVHLCKLSQSLLRRSDLSEDAVSKVFISFWQRRKQIVLTSGARAYLFSAVARQSLYLLSRHARGTTPVPLAEVPETSLVEPNKADSELHYRECLNEIENLLQAMPSKRREIFKLCRLENLRYREVASRLGLSEHTVRNQMMKANEQIGIALPRFRNWLRNIPDSENPTAS